MIDKLLEARLVSINTITIIIDQDIRHIKDINMLEGVEKFLSLFTFTKYYKGTSWLREIRFLSPCWKHSMKLNEIVTDATKNTNLVVALDKTKRQISVRRV